MFLCALSFNIIGAVNFSITCISVCTHNTKYSSFYRISSFTEKHLLEISSQDIESPVGVASPKKNKCNETDDEEEEGSERPVVTKSPKRKKQLDTSEQ